MASIRSCACAHLGVGVSVSCVFATGALVDSRLWNRFSPVDSVPDEHFLSSPSRDVFDLHRLGSQVPSQARMNRNYVSFINV